MPPGTVATIAIHADRLARYEKRMTTWPNWNAALSLGVSERTVIRYRRLLGLPRNLVLH